MKTKPRHFIRVHLRPSVANPLRFWVLFFGDLALLATWRDSEAKNKRQSQRTFLIPI